MTPKPPPSQAIVGKAGWGVGGVDYRRLLTQFAFSQVYRKAFSLPAGLLMTAQGRFVDLLRLPISGCRLKVGQRLSQGQVGHASGN